MFRRPIQHKPNKSFIKYSSKKFRFDKNISFNKPTFEDIFNQLKKGYFFNEGYLVSSNIIIDREDNKFIGRIKMNGVDVNGQLKCFNPQIHNINNIYYDPPKIYDIHDIFDINSGNPHRVHFDESMIENPTKKIKLGYDYEIVTSTHDFVDYLILLSHFEIKKLLHAIFVYDCKVEIKHKVNSKKVLSFLSLNYKYQVDELNNTFIN